jgi:hypothetical protein
MQSLMLPVATLGAQTCRRPPPASTAITTLLSLKRKRGKDRGIDIYSVSTNDFLPTQEQTITWVMKNTK